MSTSDLSSSLLESLARRFGTPLYAYSQKTIEARYRALDGALRGVPHKICYALKANSNGAICRVLARLGAGADVVSGGELQRALKAGFQPKDIVFAGVGKTEEEIRFAVAQGIRAIHVESEEELELIDRIASRLDRRAAIALRINPDIEVDTHSHIATGRGDSKFGLEPLRALKLYEKAAESRALAIVGMHCHIGSQIQTAAPYKRALSVMLELVRALNAHGIYLNYLDVGGGLGIAYGGEKGLSIEDWAGTLRAAAGARPDLTFFVEPGRWLTADAGVLLTRVLYRKETRAARHLIVDAGMNDLIRPALYGARHPIAALNPRRGAKKAWTVSGPVCESADVFERRLPLADPRPGDLLAILKAGAYGYSMASQYNSRLRPPEVLVAGSQVRLIRRRETLADLTGLER